MATTQSRPVLLRRTNGTIGALIAAASTEVGPPMEEPDLFRCFNGGDWLPFASRLSALFLNVKPMAILQTLSAVGIDDVAVVGLYEKVKRETGRPSKAFESGLAGRFVFTS